MISHLTFLLRLLNQHKEDKINMLSTAGPSREDTNEKYQSTSWEARIHGGKGKISGMSSLAYFQGRWFAGVETRISPSKPSLRGWTGNGSYWGHPLRVLIPLSPLFLICHMLQTTFLLSTRKRFHGCSWQPNFVFTDGIRSNQSMCSYGKSDMVNSRITMRVLSTRQWGFFCSGRWWIKFTLLATWLLQTNVVWHLFQHCIPSGMDSDLGGYRAIYTTASMLYTTTQEERPQEQHWDNTFLDLQPGTSRVRELLEQRGMDIAIGHGDFSLNVWYEF